MTLKAIILDIDGTLFTSNKDISPKTKQALLTAQQNGMTVILASGRPTTGMLEIAKTLDLAAYEGYLVSYNGAKITDCKTQEVIYNQAIPPMVGKQILEHLKQFDVIPMVDKDQYMYVNDVYNNTLQLDHGPFNIIEYESRGGNFQLCEQPDLASFVDFPINKLLVAGQPEVLQACYKDMYAPFAEHVTSAFSAPFYYEFTAKNIDKANALKQVFPALGISSDEMIAFGDGQNDQSIIEYAGVGVAMGNAVPELKAVANFITTSNDEDGIALALEKFVYSADLVD